MYHRSLKLNWIFWKYYCIGNACELLSVGYYDRVYCGAGVPPAESSFMKALIKVLFLFKSKTLVIKLNKLFLSIFRLVVY